MHTYTHTYIHTHTHIHAYTYTHAHTQTYKHTNDSLTHASLSYVPFTISCLFPPFPILSSPFFCDQLEKLTCGVIRSFSYIFSGYDYDIHLIHTLDRRPQSGQCYGLELEPPTATSNRASIFKNAFPFQERNSGDAKIDSRSKLWLCINRHRA